MQRENKDNLYPRRPVQEAAAIHSKEGHSNRPGIRHPDRQSPEPEQRLERDESLVCKSKCPAEQGVSAFAASPVRPVLLRHR